MQKLSAMQHLQQLLTRLQTLELRLAREKHYAGPDTSEATAYELGHETRHYDSFSLESELRLLTDMAVLDLAALEAGRLQPVLAEAEKVRERLHAFWAAFHDHLPGYGEPYPADYFFRSGLYRLLLLRGLQPDDAGVLVTEKLVDDLGEAVKLRERFLAELLQRGRALLAGGVEGDKAEAAAPAPPRAVGGQPAFAPGAAQELLGVLGGYFSAEEQPHLEALLLKGQAPPAPLLFRGNGNQLADAFKQLYEANLIVGCLKGELEEWLAAGFGYVHRGGERAFSPGYLAAVISSNTKPCQSPILDVKRQPGGGLSIVPVQRTQKNYTNGRKKGG